MHLRVCPVCGEEYRPEISVCADCGGLLEDHYDDGESPSSIEVPAAPTLDIGMDLVRLLSAERAAALDTAAQRLGASGIPYLVRTRAQDFTLLVRVDDAERAAGILRDLLPERSDDHGAEFDPERGGYLSCPACHARLDPGLESCPDCGLVLAESGPETCGDGTWGDDGSRD